MAQVTITYDRRRDTLYAARRGVRSTMNFVWGIDETLRLDPANLEVVGWTVTNFSLYYPKLARYTGPRKRWFISDFLRPGQATSIGSSPPSVRARRWWIS